MEVRERKRVQDEKMRERMEEEKRMEEEEEQRRRMKGLETLEKSLVAMQTKKKLSRPTNPSRERASWKEPFVNLREKGREEKGKERRKGR
jgi:hypothetical protein